MKPRRGLTLVELLAVIAIIGLLAGLLLPGVQSTREASRRSVCANNMRQLGQGLQQFHAARGSLPVTTAAWVYNSLNPNLAGGASSIYRRTLRASTGSDVYTVYTWVLGTLPFVEQQSLYDRFNLSQPTSSTTNLPLAQTPVPILICPSDPDAVSPILPRRGFSTDVASSTDDSGGKIHGLWYCGSSGPSKDQGTGSSTCGSLSPDSCSLSPPTDYAGEDLSLDKANRLGMFGARWLPTKCDDAQDGLSNTFLLVETMPKDAVNNAAYTQYSPVPTNQSGIFTANPVISLSVQINVPIPSTGSPFKNPDGAWSRSNAIYAKSPRSAHPGGCTMLMCDGAVVFFSELTPLQLLCRLGNRKDGEIAIVP